MNGILSKPNKKTSNNLYKYYCPYFTDSRRSSLFQSQVWSVVSSSFYIGLNESYFASNGLSFKIPYTIDFTSATRSRFTYKSLVYVSCIWNNVKDGKYSHSLVGGNCVLFVWEDCHLVLLNFASSPSLWDRSCSIFLHNCNYNTRSILISTRALWVLYCS